MRKDFLDFDVDDMYFDLPLDPEADRLIGEAAAQYGSKNAEMLLLRAFLIAPEHLSVLVALYRYYYYQHRLADAVRVVDHAVRISARLLRLHEDWRDVESEAVAAGAHRSVGLVRFYLLALKAAGFVRVRMGEVDEGTAAMKKVLDHDPCDRLKTKDLLDMILSYTYSKENENVLRYSAG